MDVFRNWACTKIPCVLNKAEIKLSKVGTLLPRHLSVNSHHSDSAGQCIAVLADPFPSERTFQCHL